MTTDARPNIPQLFAYPFRIFFVCVGVFAVVTIPLWTAIVTGKMQAPMALHPFAWHAHEMLYGFFTAAVAGFLLTAVCNWTQTVRLHGKWLTIMFLVWLAGRITVLCGGYLPYWLIAVVNLAFVPFIIVDAGRRVWLRRQTRQYTLVVVLTLLWLMQLGFWATNGDMHFAHGTLVLAMGVMLIIGGRITPNFSRNWLNFQNGPAEKVTVYMKLEKATTVSIFALLAVIVAGYFSAIGGYEHYHHLVALVAFLAAIITFVRLALWKGWLVLKEPLLWILHLSLLWIPIALLLLTAHHMGWGVNGYAWIHAMGVGAMAGLIVGVMTRVALGHTGRMMLLPRFMVATYVMIHGGAIIRLIAEFIPSFWVTGVTISAVLWTLTFLLFLWRYIPILASPRADGRPG